MQRMDNSLRAEFFTFAKARKIREAQLTATIAEIIKRCSGKKEDGGRNADLYQMLNARTGSSHSTTSNIRQKKADPMVLGSAD